MFHFGLDCYAFQWCVCLNWVRERKIENVIELERSRKNGKIVRLGKNRRRQQILKQTMPRLWLKSLFLVESLLSPLHISQTFIRIYSLWQWHYLLFNSEHLLWKFNDYILLLLLLLLWFYAKEILCVHFLWILYM